MATVVHYEYQGNAISHVLSVDEVAEVHTLSQGLTHTNSHSQLHTGATLAATLKRILDAFGIENKVR